jgi:hypothetical protein
MAKPPVVLVINPYAADFKLYDEWMHPLGLYFLITLLKRNGIDVHFFNCLQSARAGPGKKYGTGDFDSVEIEKPALYRSLPRKYKLYGRPQKEFMAFFEMSPEPDLVCIGSMMTYWLPGVAAAVRIVRDAYPKVPLLIGGIAARLMPDAVKKVIPGIMIGGTLDGSLAVPFLDKTIRVLKKEEPLSLLGGLQLLDKPRHGPILTSLGCPMACSYCGSRLLQGEFRRRPRDLVVREISFCSEHYQAVDFAFYDDALLFEPGRGITPLLADLASRQLTMRLHAPNGLHLRFIDERLAEQLKTAGFAALRFGYESGAAEYGADTSMKITRQEAKEKIGFLAKAGFDKSDIGVYVMAGLPGQMPLQVIEEVAFVASLGVKAKPVSCSPVPGTPLFERYAQQFPQLRTDPLWHNDTFFITQLPGWNWDAVEALRLKTAELNAQ